MKVTIETTVQYAGKPYLKGTVIEVADADVPELEKRGLAKRVRTDKVEENKGGQGSGGNR